MTTNEKNLESTKPLKSGDQQVAGSPISNPADNAQHQRQEKLTALKAFRFTSGDSAPFTIDMGYGQKVQDKRPEKTERIDSMDSILKQARTMMEAKDLDTALLTRDLGISAQRKLDEINRNGDGREVYDNLNADDKKMVHLEIVNGKVLLKIGDAATVSGS
jgi:hypothetical protein